MNAKSLLIGLSLFAVELAACGPAATTAAPVPVFPPATSEPPYEEPAATSAPEPTEALDYYPTQPPPLDNTFQDYGVNPYTNAAEDHLSTFALDVDTASYTVARRYVMDGNQPPPDAIRVEEFVNHFKQDYPNPTETTFGIYADGAPSPFLRDNTQLWRIGLHGHSIPDSERLPASLTFVIDISGSMSMENRLELVKRSLQLLVDRLRPTDTVSIIVFGSDARVLLNPTSGEDRATILNAIYSLQPEGATNAEAGLQLGYEIANLAYRADGINRVILCSDGVANVGATGPDAILKSIRAYADADITLTTVGFGMGNFNDTMMEQLADNGDGNYAYVDDLEEAKRLFVDNLTSTLQVIALNAKVQVDFNSEVVSYYRLIGYENRAVADQDFRNNEVDAGEIGAGHTVTALYALQLRPNATGRLATVNLRWENPQTHAVQEVNGDFNTWDLTPSFDQASLRYQLDVVVAQYAEVLRRSPWAQGTSLSDLYIRAARLSAQIPDDPDVAEFAGLVGRASEISDW